MLEHIVTELNECRISAIEMIKEIHQTLVQLSSYTEYSINLYDSDLHEVFEYPSLVKGKWGLNILNLSTIGLLYDFNNQWVEYRRNKPYSDTAVFIYLDPKWQAIISNYLIPTLESMENDFTAHNIHFESYKVKYNPSARPSDEALLERASILYNLLYKNNIIEKYYLNDD